MCNFLKQISRELIERAFLTSDEREGAWLAEDALKVIDELTQCDILVLGGEIWVPKKDGIQLIDYTWDTCERNKRESWKEYLKRANQDTKQYVLNNSSKTEWGMPHFNICAITKSEYNEYREAAKDSGSGRSRSCFSIFMTSPQNPEGIIEMKKRRRGGGFTLDGDD